MEPLKLELISDRCSDAYMNAPVELVLRGDDGKYRVFHRSGITAPGYPDHACYVEYTDREVEWFRQSGPAYVFEARRLWLSREWYAYYREHGKTPAEGGKA